MPILDEAAQPGMLLWHSTDTDKLCGFCWESLHTLPVRVTSRCFSFVPSSNIWTVAQTHFALANLEKKNYPHPKSCEAWTLQSSPGAPLLQEGSQQQEAIRWIQSSSPQKTSLCLIIFFFSTHLIHTIQSFAYLSYFSSVIFSRLNNPSLLYFSLQYSCSISP